MITRRFFKGGFVLLAALTSASSSTDAQIIIGGGFAEENLNGPQLRVPGEMVISGIARSQNAILIGAPPNITEGEDTTPSPRETFVSDAVDLLMDQIRAFVAFIGNRYAVRGGWEPIFEDDGTPIGPLTGALGGLLDSSTDNNTDRTTRTGGRTSRKSVNR